MSVFFLWPGTLASPEPDDRDLEQTAGGLHDDSSEYLGITGTGTGALVFQGRNSAGASRSASARAGRFPAGVFPSIKK